MNENRVQRVAWVLWPAFMVSAVAEFIVFALIDPAELNILGATADVERMPIYTAGFFFFWAITSAASALTVFLQRSPFEVNRCPLPGEERPLGCPKREEGCAADGN
jgi:hypothetical protein